MMAPIDSSAGRLLRRMNATQRFNAQRFAARPAESIVNKQVLAAQKYGDYCRRAGLGLAYRLLDWSRAPLQRSGEATGHYTRIIHEGP